MDLLYLIILDFMENTINLDLFSPKKAELQGLAKDFKDLKINWIDDKVGFKKVHEAQMTLRNARVWIQKTRKEYTKQFDEAKKQAMDLEKELLEIITPIEDNLKEQKEAIEAEKERIKEEERQKKAVALQARVDDLAKVNFAFTNLSELAEMSEEAYNSLLSEKQKEFAEAEAARKEKEEAEKIQKEKADLKYLVINSSSLEVLDGIQTKILDTFGVGIYEAEFKADVEQKKEMLEFNKKQADLEEKERKLKEDQEKLEKEKEEKREAERKERINGLRRELMEAGNLEELKKAFNSFSPMDKEALEVDFETLSNKIIQEEKDRERKAAEEAAKEKAEQEKLEADKKYKKFLADNEGKYDHVIEKEDTVILVKIVAKFKKNGN